jgi:hypothetical protein
MRSLLLVFANICLLRRGPEHVPTQPWFVGVVVAANLLVSFVVSRNVSGALPPLPLLTALIVTMATTALITWFLLSLRGLDARFPATITAMFGCDLLFAVVNGVFVTAVGGIAAGPVVTWVVVPLSVWSIAVSGFILHRAMAVSLVVGFVIAFAMAVFGFTLASAAAGQAS